METPTQFGEQIKRNWAFVINQELERLKEEIEKASPVYKGPLRKSWEMVPYNPVSGQGSLQTNNPYFPNVEAGLPKGYATGSQEVGRLEEWARNKLNRPPLLAAGMARNIALKYKAEGRPGLSYIGAAPKSVPKSLGAFAAKPVQGGLIDQAFRRLDKEFK